MKTDFTLEQIKIMIEIIGIKNYGDLSLRYISKEVSTKSSYDYDLVIKYLLFDKTIVELEDNKVYINHKLLRDLLDEQEIINIIANYLDDWHMFSW